MVKWLRFCTPNAGTQFQSLAQEAAIWSAADALRVAMQIEDPCAAAKQHEKPNVPILKNNKK